MKKVAESMATAGRRVGVSVVTGIIGGALVGIFISWKYAPLATWDLAAIVFLVWIWASLSGLDAAQTKRLAVREDPNRATVDIILIIASVASLGAVGALLIQSGSLNGAPKILLVFAGIASVVLSWSMVHALYALEYARQYYKDDRGGIDFNTKAEPCYIDFIYLALTIGMTFQVSDTNLQTVELRRTALHHAVLSYIFGTVIVATTINLVAGLGK